MERKTSSLVVEKKADPSTSFKISTIRVNEGRFGYSRSQQAAEEETRCRVHQSLQRVFLPHVHHIRVHTCMH